MSAEVSGGDEDSVIPIGILIDSHDPTGILQ